MRGSDRVSYQYNITTTFSNRVDEFDDTLGCVVARSSLVRGQVKADYDYNSLCTFPPMRTVLGTNSLSGFFLIPFEEKIIRTEMFDNVLNSRL